MASPDKRETADHSLPYCTAVALVDGAVSADQFSESRLTDPALLDLVARTTVIEDPALTTGYPGGNPEPGDGHAGRWFDPGFRGRLLRPVTTRTRLTDAQLAVKFHGLIDPVLGHERGELIWARLSKVESDPRPHEAIALLDRPF